MMSRTASAPMPAQKMRPVLAPGAVLLVELPELDLADGHERLERLDLGAGLLELVLLALGLGRERLALGAEGLVHGRDELLDLLLGPALLVGARGSGAPR